MDAERVRKALETSKAIVSIPSENPYHRKIASRKKRSNLGLEAENKRRHSQLPPLRLVMPQEPKPKSVMKTVKPPSKPRQRKVQRQTKDPLYDANVRFFSGYTSSQETRKRFGVQRIVQDLQRTPSDYETYGNFFEKSENWAVYPLQEMNLLRTGETKFTFEPQCILGIGGQGCVFLGKIGSVSYAFKIRSRTPSAIHSGTASSPGRRKSPVFRAADRGRIEEQVSEDQEINRGKKKRVNFIDDSQQESLHREAVAAFRVYSHCNIVPKPLLYGYTGGYDFEVFVMESMDYTLNDFVRGTTWKTRMEVLPVLWSQLRSSFEGCSRAGVVHYDIKPENLAFKLDPGTVSVGLLDFGITKSQAYSLDKFLKGGKIYRPPGTVTFMGPRAHLWKPMSWIDDFLASFFTMYIYGTIDGKSSFEKLRKPGLRRFKYPISPEDRKTLSPEEIAIYCLKYPPWARFPYGASHPIKKRQNENIVKEEISLAMLKIHSISSPENIGDIVSIILNLDGFLDDTVEMQGADDADKSGLSAAFLEDFLAKNVQEFVDWWLGFAAETRALIGRLHSATGEGQRKKNFAVIQDLLRRHVEKPEEIEGLMDASSCGRFLIEADMEIPFI